MTDPGERMSFSAPRPVLHGLLRQHLALQRQRNTLARADEAAQPEQEIDEESIRRLRALGYVR